MDWLIRWYSRRVVNVNVNVIVAGALALGITVAIMHLLDRTGLFTRIEGRFHLPAKVQIGVTTFVVDLVADVVVYYALHWLANHMPRQTARIINPAYANLSFVKDATLVQMERAALSPLLYLIALGIQHWMLNRHAGVGEATAIGFGVGIGTTRVLHTAWMLLQERRFLRKLATGPAKGAATGAAVGGAGDAAPGAVARIEPAGDTGAAPGDATAREAASREAMRRSAG